MDVTACAAMETAPAGSAAEAIAGALARAGTRLMFGVPGGGPNLDVVGAAAAAGMRFVLARGETAATIMAATCADLTGTPGAVVVTRGPGLASAVNGIAHAALDRLPVVVIADTVPAADAGRISHQRIDQTALGRSVAKAAVTVGGRQAGQAAERTVRTALAAPPGPVIANMDDSVSCRADGTPDSGDTEPGPDPGGTSVLAGALRAARRPVLLLGAGAIPRTGGHPGRPGRPRRPGAAHLPGPRRPARLRRRGGRAGHRRHDGMAAAQHGRSRHRAGRGRGRDDSGAVGLRRADRPGHRAGDPAAPAATSPARPR